MNQKQPINPKEISIADYDYELPHERIAEYPKAERDASKLLIHGNDQLQEDMFRNVVSHLPGDSIIIFNNTRVVEARLVFQKPSGSRIEIFCLEPDGRYGDISGALIQQDHVYWKCFVGNASSWNAGLVLGKELGPGQLLQASLISRETDHFLIRLSWIPADLTFAEILHLAGLIPLPPYIKRKPDQSDQERYQTVYARQAGSVAAPTAGLHFTEEILGSLATKNIAKEFVTLHVGAGTFKPVKTEKMQEHEMHSEFIEINKSLIETLLSHSEKPVTAVGTTSLRTLESIYWIGLRLFLNPDLDAAQLAVSQWIPYEHHPSITSAQSFEALLKWMTKNETDLLVTRTSLLIAPSYEFRVADCLITNFHQPRSTLLLLVAAFIGESWRNVYAYALENGYRFLSYGDACLFFRRSPPRE